MKLEAVVLTGGQSSRMGVDKSSMTLNGEAMGSRIARLIAPNVSQVTVLGAKPLDGFSFLQDVEVHQGPLVALSHFVGICDAVYVSSCDMPLFDPKIIRVLSNRLSNHDSDHAVVPMINGALQPLCAIYRASAFQMIKTVIAEGHRSMMAWLDTLWVEVMDSDELAQEGVDPRTLLSADNPDSWRALTETL